MRMRAALFSDRDFFSGGKLERSIPRDERESRLTRLADAAKRCCQQGTRDMFAGMGEARREIRPYRVARG